MSELLAPSRPVVAESPPLVALRRRDDLLAQAVDAMEFRCAPESAAEAFPGLHVSASQARRLLELPPENERSFYLHPGEHGQPESAALLAPPEGTHDD
ncbi:hypothetical protein [Streptomyces sp. Mg1]|uniref:hypothetical protein n=1 Tax=Streptomyces sp. Mg1 TaxID=465541 RepID=UPI00055BDE09|nr:hypothetical protein [Streptomyces sp. Mg1]AKL69245.1 hypothetical protein M444_31895 [Streptomyces sp. Mg1]